MNLIIQNLTVAYDQKPVLREVNLTIPAGRMTAIVGPNGAGKSTLIKAILGLIPRLSGKVLWGGATLEKPRGEIAYVPQRGSVDWDFPINVLEVTLMGCYGRLGWFRRPGKSDREGAMHCLEQVGMTDFAKRQIGELSGGQQQRVFLARALLQDAPVYMLDEPLAGVDASTEVVILERLRAVRDSGKLVLVVHHDLQTVQENFDDIVLLNGSVVAYGDVLQTMTADNLRKTYGGKLVFLQDLD